MSKKLTLTSLLILTLISSAFAISNYPEPKFQTLEKEFKYYLNLADENSNGEAQLKVGNFFENGHGVKKDKVKAYVYYTLASLQEEKGAKEALDKLKATMTAEQISEGKKLFIDKAEKSVHRLGSYNR